MRTDFVTNISHELKTSSALAVLADAIDGETDLEVASCAAADRHGRTAPWNDDRRPAAAVADRSARTDDEVIELAGVVQSAIGRGRYADSGRGVQVMAIDPPEPIRVLADGRQLTSAIGNLVENAAAKVGGVVQVRACGRARWRSR
jgi:signal transduction histidine kinase